MHSQQNKMPIYLHLEWKMDKYPYVDLCGCGAPGVSYVTLEHKSLVAKQKAQFVLFLCCANPNSHIWADDLICVALSADGASQFFPYT